MTTSLAPSKAFWITAAVNALWINASEVFRYFAFVMPITRESFPQIENVAPMNLTVFAVWGLWDTILLFAVTGFVWMFLERFGHGKGKAILAGTLVWLAVFGILWLGLWNMNLATTRVLAFALPLSLLELIVAALIVHWGMNRFNKSKV